jgi:nitronate monooxygenase
MPHRVLHNSTTEAWERAGRPAPGDRPGEGETIAEYPGGHPIERYGDDLPMEGVEGDLDALALYAGQSSGLTDDVRPAAEVVEELVAETEARIDQLSAVVQ